MLDQEGLGSALQSLAMGVALTDAHGRITHANLWLCKLLGIDPADLYGLALADFRTPGDMSLRVDIRRALLAGDTWQSEVELSSGMGNTCSVLESAYPLLDAAGRVTRVLHFFHDVSSLRGAERLGRLAFNDQLTGLPNRNLLTDRMKMLIEAIRRSRRAFAVYYIDVDELKRVNDLLGYAAGDALLRTVAAHMTRALRASDSVARIGGDEFAVLSEGICSAALARRTAEKLLRACTGWYRCEDRQYGVTFDIGIALYPDDGSTPEALLQHAESAMYRAKVAKRAAYRIAVPCVGIRYVLDDRSCRN